MINVSNDFKKRMEESRNFKDYAQVTFADGSEMTLDSDQFVPTNSALSDGADDGFPIGEAVEKIAQIEILNDDQQYADKDFLGAKIRLYTDFQLDDVDLFGSINLFAIKNSVDGYLSDSNDGTITSFHGNGERTSDYIEVLPGDILTIQTWATSPIATTYGNYLIDYMWFSDKTEESHIDGKKRTVGGQPGFNHGIVKTVPAPDTAKYIRVAARLYEDGKIKVEKGSVETDYSLAPEDIRTERIEKGTYTVITPETYGETVIITAYDDMYKADKDYTTALTFPQTAGAVLRDICDTCDISLGSSTFLHNDFIIQNKPTGKFREVIGQIAMIACGNARIDRQNRLQIISYNLEWGYNANVVAGENLLTNTKSVLEYNASKQNWNFGNQNNVSVNETDKETDSRHFVTIGNGNSNNGLGSYITGIQFKKGEVYTFSCDIKGTYNDSYEFGGQIFFTDTNGSAWANVGKTSWKEFVTENEFSRCSFTFTIPDSYNESVNRLIINIRCQEMDIYVKRFKLEKGSTATPWTPAPSDNLTPYLLLDEFTAPKIEYNDTVITGFKTIIKGETPEDDTEILQGTDTYCITVENPLISGQEKTVLSWLLERIGNVPFRPFSGDAISNPLVEFMDLAKVKDRRGNEYNTFVTDVNFLMPGYTTLKNSTPSATRSVIAYTSNSARVEQRARQLVELEKNARELAVERLQEALAQGSGLYPTEERQPDGSTIYYLHDKPTKAESKVVIKLTSEGIGISQNGGKDYPWGITFTGQAILDLIYAVGIDCDYLTTGAITVKDNSGNIIFQVDMDTKSVTISGDHVRIGGKSATTAISDNLKESKDYTDGKLSDYADTVTKNFANVQKQLDGQIESYFEDYEPTMQNKPASEWTNENDRLAHEGDIFYWEKEDGTSYAYRFMKDSTTSAWGWNLIQDTDITKAIADAAHAQDTADGKRRNFVITPYPPYDIGDQWSNGDDVLVCTTARAKGASFVSSDWQKLNKYTDDTVANQALDEARKSTNLTIILDNEYQGIPTDSAGNYSGTLDAKTVVQTYYGHTNVSASCTYSQKTSTGVTGKWDVATRTYTVTALTADTGWVDITASYMSLFTVTKRFNVAKVRAGIQGTQGINLVLKSDVVNTNANYETHIYDLTEEIKLNEPYTVTIWGTLGAGKTFFQPYIGGGYDNFGSATEIEKGVYRYQKTFTSWNSGTNQSRLNRLYIYVYPNSVTGVNSTITKIKLEHGSVTNPVWTPAPQDLVGPQGPQGATGAQGPKGDTGAAGRTYFIELSANVLKRGANNAVTPATITANAYYRDGTSATRVAYAGRWIVATSTDGNSFSTLATSSADEATHSQAVGTLAVNIVAVRFTLCAAGGTTTALDMQTAPVLIDVANLTHEQIFNLLTNNGALKGIYQEGGELYVNATYIKSGTIAADRIGAGSITSGKIASGAVTADKLSVIALSAISADLGTITAGIIQSPDFKMSNYAPGTSAATGTVLSGCRLSLTDKAFYTPQITIKEDYIQLIGYLTVGSRKSGAAIGAFSSAFGITNVASEYGSHAEGANTTASGMFSHAEGSGTTAKGNSSHAEGINTTADGYSAHAEGYLSKATGDYSHAEGSGEATKNYSHAEGAGTTASGSYSHAEGWLSEATGNESHAEGYHTTASGSESHAEGQSCTASASCAHAGGISCNASHSYSFAHGNELETGANSQFVVGKYNAKDTSLFCVGAGSSATSRKNVFSVSDASAVFDAILRVTTGILLGNASTVAYIYTENNDGNIYFRYTTTAGSTTYSNVRSIVTALSDERKKTNIKPIAYEDIAEFFDRMVPISYGIPSQDDKFHVGFSAQKLEQAMAECGLPDNMAIIQKEPERDEYGSRIPDQYEYRLNYNEIVPILVSKIQQQDREIKALKEEFANLRSEIETIKSNYAHIQ